MSRVFKQQTNRAEVGILHVPIPVRIHHCSKRPSTYEADGRICKASCLGCLEPTCMRFAPDELRLSDERLNEFPADLDDSVCPLNAIIWPRDAQTPTVDAKRCINCGICAHRCPFGAIYSNGDTAVIHSGESEIHFVPECTENSKKHTAQIDTLFHIVHFGEFVSLLDAANPYLRLSEQTTGAQFPNLIIRNLFLVLGNQCIIRRRGDVYFRIDAIAADSTNIGIAEIEFHKDSLESPRAVLDDIAVLCSRYAIDKTRIVPFIVFLELPNLRTEYWRVIKDIRDVLGIRIHTITLGALCIVAWRFNNVAMGDIDFYADVDAPSIRKQVEKLCELEELGSISWSGVLEPKK